MIGMFAPRIEVTPVPAKGSGISQSELRWLFRHLPTAGIPPVNRLRPAPASIPVIDLTGGDSNSDSDIQNLRVRSQHKKTSLSEDDQHGPQLHTRGRFSSSSSRFASLPFRQREVPKRKPMSPERSHRQVFDRRISHSTQEFSPLLRRSKRKESAFAEDDDELEAWSAKRMRPRKVIPSVEVGLGGGSIFVDDLEHNSMDFEEDDSRSSTEEEESMDSTDDDYDEDYDGNQRGGENIFTVERVIAEKRGRRGCEFLLAWVGYEELNWVPASDCRCDELIAEFRAVSRVGVVAESLAAGELEEERVHRSENVARMQVARPVRVKRPSVRGARSFRNPQTRTFERKRVEEIQSESEWEIIQSDKESNAGIMSDDDDDVLRDTAANTTHMLPTRPSLGPCDAQRKEATPLSSMAESSSQHAVRDDQTRIWIREAPFRARTPSEGLSYVDNRTQRPRQTAKMNWNRDTPDVYDQQPSSMRQETVFGVTSIRSEGMPIFSTHSAKTPRRSPMISKTTQTTPSLMRAYRTPAAGSQAPTDLVQRQISEVARAQNSRQQRDDTEASKHSSQVKSAFEESKHKRQEGKAEGRADLGRTQAERQIARGRSPPTASIDAEMAGNEGSLGVMKRRMHDMLSSALTSAPSDPSTRDSPVAAESRPRARSLSSQTQAFNTEIERGRLARQDTGPVRPELRGDVSRYYAKGLVTMAKEYCEYSENHPYLHRPETKYGFSLSNESLVLQSIET